MVCPSWTEILQNSEENVLIGFFLNHLIDYRENEVPIIEYF